MPVLTSLSAISLGITDPTGLETATNLATLELAYNNITDLSPLAGLQNQQTLKLIGNSV
jgi:Leucine-rich repeat (LRR) protein